MNSTERVCLKTWLKNLLALLPNVELQYGPPARVAPQQRLSSKQLSLPYRYPASEATFSPRAANRLARRFSLADSSLRGRRACVGWRGRLFVNRIQTDYDLLAHQV